MVEHPDKMADTTVYEVTRGKRILLWLLSAFYRCWERTIRLRMDAKSREAITYTAEPLVVCRSSPPNLALRRVTVNSKGPGEASGQCFLDIREPCAIGVVS